MYRLVIGSERSSSHSSMSYSALTPQANARPRLIRPPNPRPTNFKLRHYRHLPLFRPRVLEPREIACNAFLIRTIRVASPCAKLWQYSVVAEFELLKNQPGASGSLLR